MPALSPLFTLQSDTVNIQVCVCVSVFLPTLCVCVCVKWECQENVWILGSGLCGKISQEASPSFLHPAERGRKKARGKMTSCFTEPLQGCVCNSWVWTHLDVGIPSSLSLYCGCSCKVMQIRSSGCIEKRAVNLNTSALLLHSSNSSSSHSGIFYWKSKVYCNQTLSNHWTFVWGVYNQINIILHCSDCSRSRKWVIEPLITVKLSGFPIIRSLEQYYIAQRLWFCLWVLKSVPIGPS